MARLLGAGRSLNLLSNQAVRQITALVLPNENRIRLTVSSNPFFWLEELKEETERRLLSGEGRLSPGGKVLNKGLHRRRKRQSGEAAGCHL